jgi:DNA polymerase-3 subunit epsilon/oligoribonuclease
VLGIFLDSETNGLNAQRHRILEIAFKIIDVETGALLEQFTSPIAMTPEQWALSDPTSLQVNGFTWADVQYAPSPQAIADEIIALFSKHPIKRGKAVFICQNPSFDRVFFSQLIDPDAQEKLLWPYHWLDLASMFWSRALLLAKQNGGKYPWESGYTKDRIALAMKLPVEKQPHRAINGVNHLLLCYEAVVGFPKAPPS